MSSCCAGACAVNGLDAFPSVNGPFGPGIPDDQFGGPAPDDEHLTGVILRLNEDGSTPSDNPFTG